MSTHVRSLRTRRRETLCHRLRSVVSALRTLNLHHTVGASATPVVFERVSVPMERSSIWKCKHACTERCTWHTSVSETLRHRLRSVALALRTLNIHHMVGASAIPVAFGRASSPMERSSIWLCWHTCAQAHTLRTCGFLPTHDGYAECGFQQEAEACEFQRLTEAHFRHHVG